MIIVAKQLIEVECPSCGGKNISKNGTGHKGSQRYMCNNTECSKKSFMLKYRYNGCKHGIEWNILTNTSNAQGIRDIARSLEISTQKVIDTLKKQNLLQAT